MRRLSRSRHLLAPSALLAIALAAGAAALSLQRALTASALPYPHADRLVTLIAGSKSWSGPMLDALEARNTVFDALAAIQERAAVVGGEAGAEIVRVESVSSSYFELLGVRAARGRLFGAEDDRRDIPGAGVVVSEAFWQRRLNADPQAIGRSIDVDSHRVTVLGVAPADFRGLIGRTDIWIPLGTARWIADDTAPERPWSRGLELFGRVRAGIDPNTADARYNDEARAAIESTGAADRILGADGRLRLVPLAAARVPPIVAQATRVLGWASLAIVIFVFVNLTSLALLRSEQRARELDVRTALGATWPQIAALAARESALIAAFAACGALLLRPALLASVMAIRPPSTTFGIVTAELLSAGGTAIDRTSFLAIVSGAMIGALPAALAIVVRTRRRRGAATLRGGHIQGGISSWRSPAVGLIAVQAAVACVVLSGALLMLRSTTTLFAADRGYDWRGVTTARVSLPDGPYDAARAAAFYEAVASRLAMTNGIAQASVASCAPGAGRCRQSNVMTADGQAIPHPSQTPIGVNFATPAHFATIGAAVTRGRSLTADDRAGAPLAVVVTEPLAARLWPGVDPIGHRLEIFTANGSLNGERTVVGVVKAMRFGSDADTGSDVFLPAAQVAWTSAVIFAKSPLSRRAVQAAIADAVGAIDRGVPVYDVASLEDRLGRSLGAELFVLRTLAAFAAVGLLLAAIGAYATAAHAVSRSRRELGVRIALGATSAHIWALVGRRGLIVGLVGAAAGAAGAWFSGHLLASMLHGISARDPIAIGLAPAVTVFGLVGAVAVPAWRASRVRATDVLRSD